MLLGYSAGTLPEAFSLIVASHVSLCDECRARLEAMDALGGSVLESCERTEMRVGSLDAVLKKIAKAPKSPIRAPEVVRDSVFPAPLREYVGADPAAIKWRALGGGLRHAVIPTSQDAKARLMYIPAGTKMPVHGHQGVEATLVLQGAFQDEDGRFARGDVEIANEDTAHTPVAEAGEDCICLVVTDAPLRFDSWLPRLAQPFIGI